MMRAVGITLRPMTGSWRGGLPRLCWSALSLAVLLPTASPAASAAPLACSPRTTVLARGYGAPDDLAKMGRRVLFGDIKAGVVASLTGRKTRILVRNIAVPEGMVPLSGGRLVVVEQARNRLLVVNLRTGSRRVLIQLQNGTGQEGVDAITRAGGDIIIPDSPYGRLLRLHAGRLQVLATGMRRPVDAIAFDGGFVVPDENANAVWLVKGGRLTRLATVPVPDDVAVLGNRLLAVTLGDGALWQIRPSVTRLAAGFGQPQGLLALDAHDLVIADGQGNALYRVYLGASCLG